MPRGWLPRSDILGSVEDGVGLGVELLELDSRSAISLSDRREACRASCSSVDDVDLETLRSDELIRT